MKKVLIIIIGLFLVLNAFSQYGKDVVQLKNGSIIKGVIIEQDPNVSITIKTGDNTLVFKTDEIEKISKETISPKTKVKCDYPNRGYRGFAEISIGKTYDDSQYDHNYFDFSVINGYQIIPQLFVGGGIGFNEYFNNKNYIYSLTFFDDFRYEIIKSASSPFIEMRVGYSFGDDNDGYYISPSVGFRLTRFHLSMGYVFHEYDYEYKKTVNRHTDYDWELINANSFFARLTIDWGARRKYANATN